MRSVLIAASLVGVVFATPSAFEALETAAPVESTVVQKFGADALAYDTKVIDPNTAADIKAVVENKPAPSALLAHITDVISQNSAIESSKPAAHRSALSTAAASTKQAPKTTKTKSEKVPSANKKQNVVTPSGYTDPVAIGEAAINALVDCNGQYTYMGFRMFGSETFNIELCADACSETTK